MKALGKGSIASLVKAGLTAAWVVLWVALAGIVLGALGYGALLAMISAGWIDASLLEGGDGAIQVGGGSDFHVNYDNPGGATWPIVAPALVIGAVFVAGALVIVGRLRKLFDSFTSGEPFRRENAAHLRAIWITMLIIEVSRYVLLAGVAAIFAAVGLPAGADADFNIRIDLSTWLSIAVLIVLAEVFREGARLKEEQELTI
ncbi:MAG: DUF2975 domain-containing protein [Hyphomonadaceae bacterium]